MKSDWQFIIKSESDIQNYPNGDGNFNADYQVYLHTYHLDGNRGR